MMYRDQYCTDFMFLVVTAFVTLSYADCCFVSDRLGAFFSPLIPAITTVKLLIFFYMKKVIPFYCERGSNSISLCFVILFGKFYFL